MAGLAELEPSNAGRPTFEGEASLAGRTPVIAQLAVTISWEAHAATAAQACTSCADSARQPSNNTTSAATPSNGDSTPTRHGTFTRVS